MTWYWGKGESYHYNIKNALQQETDQKTTTIMQKTELKYRNVVDRKIGAVVRLNRSHYYCTDHCSLIGQSLQFPFAHLPTAAEYNCVYDVCKSFVLLDYCNIFIYCLYCSFDLIHVYIWSWSISQKIFFFFLPYWWLERLILDNRTYCEIGLRLKGVFPSHIVGYAITLWSVEVWLLGPPPMLGKVGLQHWFRAAAPSLFFPPLLTTRLPRELQTAPFTYPEQQKWSDIAALGKTVKGLQH